MSGLNREAFLKRSPLLDHQLEEVAGVGPVWIKRLSLSEYAKGVEAWLSPGGKLSKRREELFNARIIQLCVTDEHGEPLFAESDLATLAENQPAHILTRMANHILSVSQVLEASTSGEE